MDFLRDVWLFVGASGAHIVGVVLASVVLYLALIVVLRFWGQRLFGNRTGTGIAVAMVLGSITARSMLGPDATMLGGLVCLATLLVLESFFGFGRRAGLIGHRRAVLLMADGEIDHQMLRRYHIDERVIWAKMRQSGVTDPGRIRGVVLETDGSLSLLPGGTELDARILTNVRGGKRLASAQ